MKKGDTKGRDKKLFLGKVLTLFYFELSGLSQGLILLSRIPSLVHILFLALVHILEPWESPFLSFPLRDFPKLSFDAPGWLQEQDKVVQGIGKNNVPCHEDRWESLFLPFLTVGTFPTSFFLVTRYKPMDRAGAKIRQKSTKDDQEN